MTDRIVARGPDSGGAWVDDDGRVALGHRRLAIIDLTETGAQPMHSASGRYVISYNGEIYNHLDLRKALEDANPGLNWRGTSDTETLLAAIEHWGLQDALKRSIGMFAIALWDRKTRCLSLARDRFGEKPLYYGRSGGDLIFVSELKALKPFPGFAPEIDRHALVQYLRYGYVPAPLCIYEGFAKLRPGTIATWRSEGVHSPDPQVETYWDYKSLVLTGADNRLPDTPETLDLLEQSLSNAVRRQLISDVPIGAFLSGGIDSSTIVALMQASSSRPIRTFTIAFDEDDFNEAPFAAQVAQHLGTDHTEAKVRLRDARDVIPLMPQIYSEPFADSSQIPTFILSRVARQSVTVALSGDGGDELFGGYNRYVWGPMFWRSAQKLPFALRRLAGSAIGSLSVDGWNSIARVSGLERRFANAGAKVVRTGERFRHVRNVDDLYHSLTAQYPLNGSPALHGAGGASPVEKLTFHEALEDPAERMMVLDSVSYLPDDILVKVDRASMAVSLETRIPMLDPEVAELAWRLPSSLKIEADTGKVALRRILARHVPPHLFERRKAGFAIPVTHWIRDDLRDWVEHLLSEKRLKESGLLDSVQVRTLWRQHIEGKADRIGELWPILMFEGWRESFHANDC